MEQNSNDNNKSSFEGYKFIEMIYKDMLKHNKERPVYSEEALKNLSDYLDSKEINNNNENKQSIK